MKATWMVSLAVALAACGTTAATGGGEDVAADTSVLDSGTEDAAGSDTVLTDAVGTDAVGNELPQVDAVLDVAGTDAVTNELPQVDTTPDTAPDTFNNGCCQSDKECPAEDVCIVGKSCVPKPLTGQCWSNTDCKSGNCQGAFVCPCTADCNTAWSAGKCSDNPGSCCGGDKGGCLDSETCVKGICKSKALTTGQCWSDADCSTGTCTGATICPCGAACLVADKPGTCTDNVKPGGCCKNGGLCAAGETCVHGPDQCKSQAALSKTECWADTDCAAGTCQGANVCPCGAMCIIADKAGTCVAAPLTCTTVDPMSFGMCDMVIGVVFDGKSCVMASGCGCGKQCDAVFKDLATCQKACGI